ncbi:citramalate synthase [Egibacter rhizosphaerae]|uniref:Citramalate synthase n=1 Tax=Egibacter rhizosphaerae TaxID=1670831 RepID=A0A411YHH3_9ACTN|nr:citramalate synthase [Egibacter rhizosphaerae]QBI20785.1 citramalate synthase [Egibacter rhizosphaerae]
MSNPQVHLVEESMREGMQIESVEITTEAKIRLLDALSATGLRRIIVGSFVSPKWVPQMADIEDVIAGFTPAPGVEYTALTLNRRGWERMQAHMPPLVARSERPQTVAHLCDVFPRRNANRSQQDEIDGWSRTIEGARESGATEAGIGANAAWGSNWVGGFSAGDVIALLERQDAAWREAGIDVASVFLGDPMGWNAPHEVRETVERIAARWPEVRRLHLHLHNTRGLALASAYAAIEALDDRYEVTIDASVGGFGGCPYCGNGRAAGMIPTEDLVHLLGAMDISTGVDMDRLLDAVEVAEEVVGRALYGHVSKAGPRPTSVDELYPMDLPLVETLEEATHFRDRSVVGDGAGRRPWPEPIVSQQRQRVVS